MLSGIHIDTNNITATDSTSSIQKKLADLEATSKGGRLGISAINTNNNQRIQYRENERFPMGCTSKVIGVAAILKKSMTTPKLLEEKIIYSEKDLTNWIPITGEKDHLANGMTIEDLSAAAVSHSDNTAMNLLVNKLGGLQELNAFARSINDSECKFDHMWPDEALASPHGTDDSTTPAAMEKSLQTLTLSDTVLAASPREKLLTWMKNTVTGNARIKAGVPKDWVVGDKTGTGFYYGTTNDIAIIWPPESKPIFITAFYSHSEKNAPKREDIIASATDLILHDFAENDKHIKLKI